MTLFFINIKIELFLIEEFVFHDNTEHNKENIEWPKDL